MKVAFVSNFLNHHQLPLCLAFREILGDSFKFIATSAIPQERIDMKYEDMNHKYDFVLCSYDGDAIYRECLNVVKDYDIVIIGSASLEFLELRMNTGKITFRYCERSLKKGIWRRFIPTTAYRIYKEYLKYRNKQMYVLSASAYTSYDLSICGFPYDKCFKWGYFPEFRTYENIDELLQRKRLINGSCIKILWVARLIKLKHPECVVYLAAYLKKMGYQFHIDIVGDGPMRNQISNMISSNDLESFISLRGVLNSQETRDLMELSDIFLFTSDSNEGWGAVINESMNSACAVVSSHVVGSAPYLIHDGETGLIYEYDNQESLFSKVRRLLDNPSLRENIARSAYLSIKEEWNAKVAVKRLFELVQLLKSNKITTFLSGPCSQAQVCVPGEFIKETNQHC